MNRNDFGLWGIDLSPEDFRQALAALGLWWWNWPLDPRLEFQDSAIAEAIEKGKPIRWRDPLFFINHFRDHPPPPARNLADAWKEIIDKHPEPIDVRYFTDRQGIRFEVHGEMVLNNLWYIEQLSRPEVGATSVYAWIDQPPTEVVWDWPLRVGLMSDPSSRQLRTQIEDLNKKHPWVGRLVKIVDFQAGENECDLLLLPQNLRSALSAVLQAPSALNTDCVLVLGRVEDSALRSLSLIEALRTQTRASGVGLIHVPSILNKEREPLQKIWFKELLRHISHNQPIDVALYRSCRDSEININTPLLIATRDLADLSLVSRRLDQFVRDVSAISFWRKPEPDELRYFRNIDRWRLDQTDLPWDHESDTASEFARSKETVESKVNESTFPPPKTRWIQAEVWEQGEGERRATRQFLRPGTSYGVVVFVGTPSEHSISADSPFNEEALPDQSEHQLVVSFSEPQISPEPQVATITLPRVGNSSPCQFYMHVPSGIAGINARITILYRNRILQTALLQAPVLEAPGTEAESEKIKVVIESVIRPGMQDLSSRTWFDGALVINHAANGTAQITKTVGENVTRVQIADLAEAVKWFDDQITEVAEKWKKFEPLGSKKSRNLLYALAMNGSTLYDGIVRAQRADEALATAERIQVLSASYGSRFPIEFIYGRMAPLPDAPLCPKAKAALINGHCDTGCPIGSDEEKVICPLGFWGLNRVIERHAYDSRDARELAGADFGIQSEPATGRNRLNVLTSALIAASNNVDSVEAGSKQKVVDALDLATGKESNCVDSWAKWISDVEERSPSLLVLLPHTVRDAKSHQQTLEISVNQRLIHGNLQRKHVLGKTGLPHPLVILMGCKTAAPDISYESFVLKFRLYGAALVVGTGSTILGRHAATVTKSFIEDIAAIKSSKVSFGELMLNARRRLVADGKLMALCLTSYGDTDWLL
jgi:hypothetical protein